MQHARLWPFGLGSISKKLIYTGLIPTTSLCQHRACSPARQCIPAKNRGVDQVNLPRTLKQLMSAWLSCRTCLCWPVWGCSTNSFVHNHEGQTVCCKRIYASEISDQKLFCNHQHWPAQAILHNSDKPQRQCSTSLFGSETSWHARTTDTVPSTKGH